MHKIKHKIKYCLICNKELGYTARYREDRNIKYCRNCFSKAPDYKEKVSKTTFKKGFTPWNKGVKGVESHVYREKNPNWQGGKTPINIALRHCLDYEQWRKSVFERDLYTCQNCNEVGGRLNADHIKPWSLYPDLRFELSNGRTLCEPCHKEIGWNLFKENNPMRSKKVGGQ